MATPARWLIVNADDLGLSAETNRGIFETHARGIVTSASLMVRKAAARQAAETTRRFPKLSIGLHVDLAEWSYDRGEWRLVYQLVQVDDAASVAAEIRRQLDQFRELTSASPTHIDSHQHLHRQPILRPIFQQIARELSVPLRGFDVRVRYCGDFYGRAKAEIFPDGITPANLCRLIRELKPGATELSCHPGFDHELGSDYRNERLAEVETLCDARIRAELEVEKVALISFADLDGVASQPRLQT